MFPWTLVGGYAEGFREAKVGEEEVAVIVDEDVGRFDIAMHNAATVKIFECDNLERAIRCERLGVRVATYQLSEDVSNDIVIQGAMLTDTVLQIAAGAVVLERHLMRIKY